ALTLSATTGATASIAATRLLPGTRAVQSRELVEVEHAGALAPGIKLHHVHPLRTDGQRRLRVAGGVHPAPPCPGEPADGREVRHPAIAVAVDVGGPQPMPGRVAVHPQADGARPPWDGDGGRYLNVRRS